MKNTISFLLFLNGITWKFSSCIITMRIARIKYIQNSKYIAAHFLHLITNQSSIATVKACALACHNSLMRPTLLFKKRHRSIIFEKEKKTVLFWE